MVLQDDIFRLHTHLRTYQQYEALEAVICRGADQTRLRLALVEATTGMDISDEQYNGYVASLSGTCLQTLGHCRPSEQNSLASDCMIAMWCKAISKMSSLVITLCSCTRHGYVYYLFLNEQHQLFLPTAHTRLPLVIARMIKVGQFNCDHADI